MFDVFNGYRLALAQGRCYCPDDGTHLIFQDGNIELAGHVLYRNSICFFIDRDDFDILGLNAELPGTLNTSAFVGFG